MTETQDDRIFLRLSPFLALFAAWGTWKALTLVEADEDRPPPALQKSRVEVPGAAKDCGATWVVELPEAWCLGPFQARPQSGEEIEELGISLTPIGAKAVSARGSSCVLRCTYGEHVRAKLIVSVAAGEFRGRARCEPLVGDPIDLLVGPVYTDRPEPVQLYTWRLDGAELAPLERFTATCPYVRPAEPGDIPASHGFW